MIFIQSKNEGFRRAGVAHTKAGQEFTDDFFTADQMKRLKADPMLSVVMMPDPEPPVKEPEPPVKEPVPAPKPKTKPKNQRAKGK
ncbi:MAG: hypothetical protein JRD89_12795 [Deltaproteobacteria bacterium]|nr:hypothetical protein [Deltaproteobacteria bacterium]